MAILRDLYSITGPREARLRARRPAGRDLGELHELTDGGDLVFPSLRPKRPLSENTLNVALRNLGYDEEPLVAHGSRSTASTLLHEPGFPPEVIDTQLPHVRPGIGGIYNRSQLLTQRRKMMQAWADYLDGLKSRKRSW